MWQKYERHDEFACHMKKCVTPRPDTDVFPSGEWHHYGLVGEWVIYMHIVALLWQKYELHDDVACSVKYRLATSLC